MVETPTPTSPATRPNEPATSPDERGTLDVRHKAIQRIVEHAVLQTPGTVAHRGTLGRLIGAGSPTATITMEGRAARVGVDVAAVWPCDVTRIATAVRDTVLAEAFRLSGVQIRAVDVTLHTVDPTSVEHATRRVQ